MTKQQKTEKVKDLLNQVVVTVGKSSDEFLVNAATTAKTLLNPPEVEEDEDEDIEDEDYYGSEDYYDSNC